MPAIDKLKGIRSDAVTKLDRIGIRTIEDLLFHFPYRYQDRTRVCPLSELTPYQEVMTKGVIEHTSLIYRRKRMLLVTIEDGGATMLLRFFHFSHAQRNSLREGQELLCFGEVRRNGRQLEMIHPEYRVIYPNQPFPMDRGYVPIYPSTEGLSQQGLRRLTGVALKWLEASEHDLEELLPDDLLEREQLPPLKESIHYIHRPPPDADIKLLSEGNHSARQRLAFEEILAHTLSVKKRRTRLRKQKALPLKGEGKLFARLRDSLPFQLTSAQQTAIRQIDADVAQDVPMMRLLQGDVGSGKTLVSASPMLKAVEAGCQAAIMVPTEVLAQQHYQNLRVWLRPLGVTPALIISKLKAGDRRYTLRLVRTGEAGVVVGTHAMFQEGVDFKRLALVVVDEQHRFGVHQRLALRQKGESADCMPHQLIMTATPIPRSLAMTMYADLDCSIINEMPAGRLPAKTVVMPDSKRKDIIRRIYEACKQGKQAYWICPLVEESESLSCQTIEATYQTLSRLMPELKIGYIHGRLKLEEKQAAIQAFRNGETPLLVSTTVIEVGVDVPSANLMVIENAERFGLAQLHQLRGRIGRGTEQANCVLMYRPPLSSRAHWRLNVMRENSDGFSIAEKDLQLRGAGEMHGTRQTGGMRYKVANLIQDNSLLKKVHQLADPLLSENPAVCEKLINRWLGGNLEYSEV